VRSADKDIEKREPFYTVGENVVWHSRYGKHYGNSSKGLKIEPSSNLIVLLLALYLEEFIRISLRFLHCYPHYSIIHKLRHRHTLSIQQ
jgi:hypothetical protein